MKYTQNYNLKKPEGTDIVNIDDLNENADIIDTQLKTNADTITQHINAAAPHSGHALVTDLTAHIASKASTTTLGHVQQGSGVTIDSNGVISANVLSVAGKTGNVTLTAADVGAETPAGAQAKAEAAAGAVRAELDAHKADYANPHQVKAEQVFALGGVPAGTTFPTSPAPYTLFFRTDLNKLFVYLP